jgi:glycosyltransferase involved in cell wall biosynthesis
VQRKSTVFTVKIKDKQVKIAIYWEQFSWGGVDTHILTLLKYWNKKDKIYIFVNEGNLGFQRIEDSIKLLDNVIVINISKKSIINPSDVYLLKLLKVVFRPLLFIASIYKTTLILKKYGGFDVLLSENGGYPAAWGCLAAIFAAKYSKIQKRVILIHHAAQKTQIYQNYFERYVDYKLTKYATDIVAVSLATRDTLYYNRYAFNNIPIRVVYNGIEVNTDEIDNSEKISLRQRYEISSDKILIGIVGRVERYKGHEDLMMGYSLLKKENQDKIQIIFIGVGLEGEMQRLCQLSKTLKIHNKIINTGYLEGDSRQIIKQLNLLCVLTKDFEGFGLTIGEAMTVGTPVLVTKVGAIPEFVTDKTGSLIFPESPYQVCEVLDEFVKDPVPFFQKAQKAKEHIKKYSAERMVEHMGMIFRES